MTARVWRTLGDGTVMVNGQIPRLSAQLAREFSGAARWLPHVRQEAMRYHLPPAWLLAIIHVESRGNPGALSQGGGVGLMQLTSADARAGLSLEALLDGPTNIRAGAAYLTRIMRDGDDLPRLASKYNAGQAATGEPHASEASPWNMRETPGYIDHVVAANNHAIALALETVPAPAPKPTTFPALALGGLALRMLLRWSK